MTKKAKKPETKTNAVKSLKKSKKKDTKTKNIQVFGSTPPDKLISQTFLIQATKLPKIIETFTLETLADTVNIYFRNPDNQPYNLAGLQYSLGMHDNELWDNLFSEDVPVELKPLVRVISKAQKYIESELVQLLLSRSQVAGLIFYLKAKFQYIEREILETISTQAIDIRFTVETEEEKAIRKVREKEEQVPLLTE